MKVIAISILTFITAAFCAMLCTPSFRLSDITHRYTPLDVNEKRNS